MPAFQESAGKLDTLLTLQTLQPGPQLWRVEETAQTQEGESPTSAVCLCDLGKSLNLPGSLMLHLQNGTCYRMNKGMGTQQTIFPSPSSLVFLFA